MANALSLLDQSAEAIQLLNGFLPLAEDKAEVYYLLGNFYRIEKKDKEAIACFKEAVKCKIIMKMPCFNWP